MGDATNMVLILAGELLKKSEHLLIMGLHPSEIIKGYELACAKALSELDSTRTTFVFIYAIDLMICVLQNCPPSACPYHSPKHH